MLKIVGNEDFMVKREGYRDGQVLYLIESRNGNSEEYLYVSSDQIEELINLINKANDLL